jgi:hypothetical protein
MRRLYGEAGLSEAYLDHHLPEEYLHEKASSC